MSVPIQPNPGSVPVATPESAVELGASPAEIDASCRGPLLLFFSKSILWLVLGTVLLLIASIKLHAPGFLADCPALTLGRVRPAAMNAILYGFASQAALGMALWFLARLARFSLCCQYPLIISGIVWNVGVVIGVLGILIGGPSGFEWLDMPTYALGFLFVSFVVAAGTILWSFSTGRERDLYVSSWFSFGGLFWFVWIFSTAALLLHVWPARGVVQGVINSWYISNFLWFWLGAIGLAAIFYFVPKLLGRPLHNRGVAIMSFWTLAFAASWAATSQMIGGPIPTWLVSTGIAGNVLLIVPLLSIGWNLYHTVDKTWKLKTDNTVLRFIWTSAICFLAAMALWILLGFRSVSAVTQFTYARYGVVVLAVFGFFGMAAFATIYYVLPRLVAFDWPCERKVKLHYLAYVGGVVLVSAALIIGGVLQGQRINNPNVPFLSVVKSTIPFIGMGTLGFLLMLAGQVAFLLNMLGLIRRYYEPYGKSAFYFVSGNDAAAAKAGVKP